MEYLDRYKEIENDWDNCMCRVGRKLTNSFEMDSVGFTNILITTNATRLLLRWIYSHLVYKRGLKPIEKLDQDVKFKMWEFVKEICAGKTNDIVRMKEIAIAFYVIEYFIHENK